MPKKEISAAAAAIGRLASGKPKNYTPEELDRRRARLAEARKARWARAPSPKNANTLP